MNKTDKLNEAYKLIYGELAYLPNKKWKKLSEYRAIFSYVKNSDIKNQIINFNLSFDYQLSLYSVHKPVGNLAEMTFICACHLTGSVCEALLRDLYFFKLTKNESKDFSSALLASKKINYIMFGDLLDIFKPLLDVSDYKYLDNMKKLRNTIHINNENNTVKIIEDSGHIVTEKIRIFDEYIIKKVFNFDYLEKSFIDFIKRFSKYY